MLHFYIYENLKDNDIGQITLLYLSKYLASLKFKEKGKKFEIIFISLGWWGAFLRERQKEKDLSATTTPPL